MPDSHNGYANDAINWLRGLCMGAADIIPGVSGGTVALILGHYERLVGAIARVDGQFFKLLTSGRWLAALQHIDFRFLAGLGAGVATGIIGLASLMHHLLTHHQAYVFALFAGMILASSHLVARRLKRWQPMHVGLLLIGAVVAWQICLLSPLHGTLTPLTAFLSATVAICAMILPGISGAFVLLLLGMYHPITELLRGLPKGEFTVEGLQIIACFVTGCAVGLISFSRLLRWLFSQRHDATMAFLVGLMLGSLYKIWPFQQPTAETAALPFKQQQFEMLWPSESSVNVLLVIVLTAVGMFLTLSMEFIGDRLSSASSTTVGD
ncbi:MAG: DUF368 domain-containing protein [Pirellulaceae bacterium]|nr:DUF368 domain-containing protein [Pirellulaceae bacterium]